MPMMRIVLVVVALAGCGGGTKSQPPPAAPVENKAETASPPPAPREPTNLEKAEAMMQAMEELGDIIERHQASCADMEREVRAFAERSREVFLRAKEARTTAEENQRLMELYGPRIEAVMPKMMHIANCPGAAQAMPEM